TQLIKEPFPPLNSKTVNQIDTIDKANNKINPILDIKKLQSKIGETTKTTDKTIKRKLNISFSFAIEAIITITINTNNLKIAPTILIFYLFYYFSFFF